MVHRAVKASEALAAENIHAAVLNISCPAKIDLNAIKKACRTGTVVVYEDHFVQSGIGSMVASLIAENELKCRFKKLGVTRYGKSCPANEQYPLQGLDSDSLKKTIEQMIGAVANSHV
jgi:transketolase